MLIRRQTNCTGPPAIDSITPGAQPNCFTVTGQNLIGATVSVDLPGVIVTAVMTTETTLSFCLTGEASFCPLSGTVTIATVNGSVQAPITLTAATPLPVDTPLTDSIGVLGERDQYCFTLAAPARVLLQATKTAGSPIQPCLDLRTAQGAPVAPAVCWNFTTGAARLDLDLAAGTYFAVVSDAGNNETGGYTVLLLPIQGGKPLTPDMPVTDTVDSLGDLDLFTFTLAAPARVLLQATRPAGSVIQPCLDLRTAQGAPVAPAVCGSNTAPTARLDLDLAAGTYFVLVSDSGNDQTGGYEMLMQLP